MLPTFCVSGWIEPGQAIAIRGDVLIALTRLSNERQLFRRLQNAPQLGEGAPEVVVSLRMAETDAHAECAAIDLL